MTARPIFWQFLTPADGPGEAIGPRQVCKKDEAVIVLRIDNGAHLSLSHLPAGVLGQIQDRLKCLTGNWPFLVENYPGLEVKH